MASLRYDHFSSDAAITRVKQMATAWHARDCDFMLQQILQLVLPSFTEEVKEIIGCLAQSSPGARCVEQGNLHHRA
jgi:hypothetical protein